MSYYAGSPSAIVKHAVRSHVAWMFLNSCSFVPVNTATRKVRLHLSDAAIRVKITLLRWHRATAPPETHGPNGAIAAGRTTTPPRRTGFISTTSVGDPKPSPRISARAWSATPGPTGPCQVTRTSASWGDALSSTERAAWSPATWDCAATPMANAAASAMPSAGSNHRTGRRRPRAAASISGANQPFTLWSRPRRRRMGCCTARGFRHLRVGSDGTSHGPIVARTRTPTACRG